MTVGESTQAARQRAQTWGMGASPEAPREKRELYIPPMTGKEYAERMALPRAEKPQ